MSNKKMTIQTQQDLDTFLAVLAEESVALAERRIADAPMGRIYPPEEQRNIEKHRQARTARSMEDLSMSWGPPESEPGLADEADEDVFAAIAKAAGEDGGKKKKKKVDGNNEVKPNPDEKPEVSDEETNDPDVKTDSKVPNEGNITFTMIRDKLNTIRSGRSLRDRNIKDELKSYVMKLDVDERAALHAFLDGIGQILTAGIESEQAQEPADDPYDIEIEKSDEDNDESNKDKVVVKPTKTKKRGLEDTSAPIQVGRTAKTEAYRRHIRELMGK